MISMCDATNANQRRVATKYSRAVGFGIDWSLFDAKRDPAATNRSDVKGHKSAAAEDDHRRGRARHSGTIPRDRAP